MARPPAERSQIMRAVKGKDTAPEMIVRRLAHGLGYRFRLHAADLPGRPDLVFRPRRSVVFVHGCFWHGHQCRRGARAPKANAEYWSKKIGRNRERDARAVAELRLHGWKALVLWECELRDPAVIERRLRELLGPPGAGGRRDAAGGTGPRD